VLAFLLVFKAPYLIKGAYMIPGLRGEEMSNYQLDP